MKKILIEYVDNDTEINKLIRKIWKKDFEFYKQAQKIRKEINFKY